MLEVEWGAQPTRCPLCGGHEWMPKGFQGYMQCYSNDCDSIVSWRKWCQLMAAGARREGMEWVTYDKE